MPFITRKKQREMWRVAVTWAQCERRGGENYQVATLADAIRLARQKNALLRAQAAERRKIGG